MISRLAQRIVKLAQDIEEAEQTTTKLSDMLNRFLKLRGIKQVTDDQVKQPSTFHQTDKREVAGSRYVFLWKIQPKKGKHFFIALMRIKKAPMWAIVKGGNQTVSYRTMKELANHIKGLL